MSALAIGIITYVILLCGGFVIWQHLRISRYKKDATITIQSLTERIKNTQTQLADIAKKREREISQSNIYSFFDTFSEYVIIISNHQTISYINPAVEKLLGLSKIQVILKPYTELFNFNSLNNILDNSLIDQTFQGKAAQIYLSTLFANKENHFPMIGYIKPFPDSDGNISALLMFTNGQPVYDHVQQIEQLSTVLSTENTQLKTQLQNTSLVIQDANIAIINLDMDGNIIFINPYAENFLRVQSNNIIGKSYHDVLFFLNQKDEPWYEDIKKAYNGIVTELTKWTFIRTQNEKFPIIGSAFPLSIKGNRMGIGIVFIKADKEYQNEFEEKAFFSSAAHDLRSPLTAIRGTMELLKDCGDSIEPVKKTEIITNCLHSTIHLISLVNDLLNVSRLEQDRIEITKSSFNIVDVTREVLKNLDILAQEKQLSIEHQIADINIPKAYGDKTKTQEILNNLISNAIKYTPQGKIIISHTVRDNTITTSIIDSGTGISPENQQLLFRKFQQVGTARKLSATKSTGLGLYISKKFAQLMDGDVILAHSEPGKGSTFQFIIPQMHI